MTAHEIRLTPNKTYATRENARKAVEKVYGPNEDLQGSADLRWLLVQTEDGRWFPVFVGEQALRYQAFARFACVA